MTSKSELTTYAIVLLVILASCTNIPIQTPPSSYTDTPISTNTVVAKFTNTPFPTNTPESKTTVFEESKSPDDTWTGIVTLTTQGESKNLLFRVFNNNTNQEWVVEQLDVDKVENPPPGGFFYPYIFKWSQDNNHLYYSHLSTGGDGCFGYFRPGGFDLKRLDLRTGETIVIRSNWATWMVLSPDEKKLAYIDTFGGNVSIIDIENEKEDAFFLPSIKNELDMVADTSDMYWSPDGKSLIYAHYVGVCDIKIWYSYIIKINADSQEQWILIEHDERGFVPIEWNIQDKILLKDNNDNHWWLNPTTKEITSANQ